MLLAAAFAVRTKPFVVKNHMELKNAIRVLAEANLFPGMCVAVFAAYRAGRDYKPALARLRAAQQIIGSDNSTFSYGPMKYALSREMGGPQTYQRPPHVDVTVAQQAAIDSALARIREL